MPEPTSGAAGCGPLHTATLATTDLAAYRRFYVDAKGLTLEGPLPLSDDDRAHQRRLWGIPEDLGWETYRLHRPAVPGLVQIRLLVLDRETPLIHRSYDSRELGPFSLGFPTGDIGVMDRAVAAAGFGSMAPMQVGTVQRPDGLEYQYYETIYRAPDFVHTVGIARDASVGPLAPYDEATTLGGPGYSAMVVDDADVMIDFFRAVLGYELRTDYHWETSPGSALGVAAGVGFRLAICYAPGSNQNHLLLLDYDDKELVPLAVAPRLPNRGLGMWSFRTGDLDAVHRRARAHGSPVVHGPVTLDDPVHGPGRALTLLAPNGFLTEIFSTP